MDNMKHVFERCHQVVEHLGHWALTVRPVV